MSNQRTKPISKPDKKRKEKAYHKREEDHLLDKALKDTFPASDATAKY